MSTEATTVDPSTTEAIEADDDAFAAGFAEGTGEPLDPADTPATEPAATDDQPSAAEAFANEIASESDGADAAAEGAATAAAVQAAVEGLSSDEVAQLRAFLTQERGSLKQGLDKIAGNVGGLKRTIDQLQAVQRTQPQGSLAAEAARKVEESIRAHISEDYPELGSRLQKTLTEVLAVAATGQPAAAPAIDMAEVDRRAEAKADEKLASYILEEKHGEDWQLKLVLKDETGKPVVGPDGRMSPSPAFRAWLTEKGPDFENQFRESNNGRFIARSISEFDTWKEAQAGSAAPEGGNTPPAPPAAGPGSKPASLPAQRPAGSKQARLAAAVTPKGTGSATPAAITEDDAFELGFRSARGT